MSNKTWQALPTFLKKFASPALQGSALKPRRKGQDEGVSLPVKAFQNEEASLNETSSAFVLVKLCCHFRQQAKMETELERPEITVILCFASFLVMSGMECCLFIACSRRAIPAKRKIADGSIIATKMPGTIQIQHREETDRHSYHGLSRCASALVCPVCSAIIQTRRAAEVMTAGQYLLQHGFQVAMITQTASHSRATSLYDFIQRFQAAQHDMKTWREYKRWQSQTGARFTIRSVETTDDNPDFEGKKTGWHYHTHTLVFFERERYAFTEQEAKHFTELFQRMWVKALDGVGLSGSLERAADVRC